MRSEWMAYFGYLQSVVSSARNVSSNIFVQMYDVENNLWSLNPQLLYCLTVIMRISWVNAYKKEPTDQSTNNQKTLLERKMASLKKKTVDFSLRVWYFCELENKMSRKLQRYWGLNFTECCFQWHIARENISEVVHCSTGDLFL